jgi:hypothetical protein
MVAGVGDVPGARAFEAGRGALFGALVGSVRVGIARPRIPADVVGASSVNTGRNPA